ncbi:MAG TPA: PepSY domain-containing protein [Methanocorpusculum sp.]|nr:PepSY domain-containing protein [Methanocorpusculum sp.]
MKKNKAAAAVTTGILLLLCLIAAAGCTAPAQNQISLEDAQKIALRNAGVPADQVTFTKSGLDYEEGLQVYEIKFYCGTDKYEYDIDTATGEIVKYSKETETVPESIAIPTYAPIDTGKYITVEKATEIALNRAGLKEEDIRSYKCELDTYDDDYRKAVYEIEFKSGVMEYDIDIDAENGDILKYKAEYD